MVAVPGSELAGGIMEDILKAGLAVVRETGSW
jgi:hypothetical protein